jgi:inositol phosphorylceramide mannosyltransferase catalytic subunit
MSDLLIPRVFHQIWLGDKPLPPKFRQWADSWLTMNPGWKMEWWTDARLPEMRNRREFDAADKMAAKSDILRYEVIWRFGGVYIDADFEPLRPIEEIIGGVNAFYGDERPDTPCNAILGCAKEDAFFGHLVQALPQSFSGPGDIVDKTGPRFLKRELEALFGPKQKVKWDIGMKRRGRMASEDGARSVWAFDWRVFYPYYYTEEQREWDAFPDAYARHHWTASWWKGGGV